ncbi:MAG: GNAT family N-acetyltransferase [Candidatus Gottesmanbacteria bacterium]|nr:GNAT family N-acetyltransferase [Candidatus Gottesmanbacteria bacterium]
MNTISFIDREMTTDEFNQMNKGFDEHTVEYHNPIEIPERHGFVAMNGDKFIGSVSGLAYKHDTKYSPYFYLSDLFVEKSYRKSGVGSELLEKLEAKIISLGITNIWTWTAGYEAPEFYLKQGYKIFAEMEHWYDSGHSRVGFRKKLI